jgi:hypothetical protein
VQEILESSDLFWIERVSLGSVAESAHRGAVVAVLGKKPRRYLQDAFAAVVGPFVVRHNARERGSPSND